MAEYPALLSWQGDKRGRGVLGMATSAYAFDVGNAQRERDFTRAMCAELLIEAGAVVAPSVCESILQSRARGLLALFQRKGLLPRTLEFLAALGDIDAVRTALEENGNDPAAVNEAFVRACLFEHEAVAELLLERCIALDPELGAKVDGGVGRQAFIKCFVETRANHIRKIGGGARTVGLWKTFVMEQVSRSVQGDDVTAFVASLRSEPWLLGDACIDLQSELMGSGRAEFITALPSLRLAFAELTPRETDKVASRVAELHGEKDLGALIEVRITEGELEFNRRLTEIVLTTLTNDGLSHWSVENLSTDYTDLSVKSVDGFRTSCIDHDS